MPEPCLIACIDDDPFVREALEGLLLSVGKAARTFASAEDFLRFPDIHDVACLVTDVKLGGMSGLQLLRQLVQDRRRIQAIVITAFGDDQLRKQALALGAIGFCNKPVRDEALLALIEAALGRSKN